MQLHQLLRFIKYGVPIILFDSSGIQICRVSSKDSIHIDLYEYNIVEITMFDNSICIELEK